MDDCFPVKYNYFRDIGCFCLNITQIKILFGTCKTFKAFYTSEVQGGVEFNQINGYSLQEIVKNLEDKKLISIHYYVPNLRLVILLSVDGIYCLDLDGMLKYGSTALILSCEDLYVGTFTNYDYLNYFFAFFKTKIDNYNKNSAANRNFNK